MKKLLTVILLLVAAGAGWSQERIEHFYSTVTIDQQGSAWAQETMTAIAGPDGQGIRYRNLPVSNQLEVEDISLQMDGKPYPFAVVKGPDFLRVEFGDGRPVAPGKHIYQLQYRIPGAVTFEPDRDLLDWNVTGHWLAPLEKVEYELCLPQKTLWKQEQIISYVGRPNNWDKPVLIEEDPPAKPAPKEASCFGLETETPLTLGRGLRVVSWWQPGMVNAAPEVQWSRFKYRYAQGWVLAEVGLILFLLGVFYYISWRRVGRKPLAEPAQWRPTPPEGFSAGKVGYVSSQGNCSMAVYASSLAVKGALEIAQDKTGHISYSVLHLKNKDAAFLSADERAVLMHLFPQGVSEFVVGLDNPYRWRGAQAAACKSLKEQGANQLFNRHFHYNAATLCALALLAGVGAQCGEWLAAVLTAVFGGICWIIGGYWWAVPCRYTTAKRVLVGALVLAVAVFFGYMMRQAHGVYGWLPGMLVAGFAGGVFSYWIASYSTQGRQIMEQIESFKGYLLHIRSDRQPLWEQAHQAAQHFCDYLPYACALGVAEKWLEAFLLRIDKSVLQGVMRERGLSVEPEQLLGVLKRLNRLPKPVPEENDFSQNFFYRKGNRSR